MKEISRLQKTPLNTSNIEHFFILKVLVKHVK